jgi:hypothetical protein
MKWFLKATGSTCYVAEGITFPVTIPVDIEKLVGDAIAEAAGGERPYLLNWLRPMSNQPAHLVAYIHGDEGDKIGEKASEIISYSEIGRYVIFRPAYWQGA